MVEKFLEFAAINPLGAAVVIAAVAGLVVAAGYAAIPLSKLVRAARAKNGNGHTEELPKVEISSGPHTVVVSVEEFKRHVEGDEEIHADHAARISRYENLTDNGERLRAHLKLGHDTANRVSLQGLELKEGGRRITALEGEVKGLREDFAEHRGDVCARLEGLETGQQELNTGQLAILAELRKLGASSS